KVVQEIAKRHADFSIDVKIRTSRNSSLGIGSGTMIQRECPSEQELTRFLLGETLDSSVDIIAEHLEECPRCEQIARRLDNLTDSAILALRRSDLTGMSRPMNSTSPPGGRSAVRVPSAVGFPEALH